MKYVWLILHLQSCMVNLIKWLVNWWVWNLPKHIIAIGGSFELSVPHFEVSDAGWFVGNWSRVQSCGYVKLEHREPYAKPRWRKTPASTPLVAITAAFWIPRCERSVGHWGRRNAHIHSLEQYPTICFHFKTIIGLYYKNSYCKIKMENQVTVWATSVWPIWKE